MKVYAVLIEAMETRSAVNNILVDFKRLMKGYGDVTVFDLEQTNYDFLLNSLIEKANKEKKGR